MEVVSLKIDSTSLYWATEINPGAVRKLTPR
jgi:hypothetical protein